MRHPAAVETAPAAPISNTGDGLQTKFYIAALASQRARQLQNGARPRVDAAGHKPCRVALLEVMAGMVSSDVT